MHEEFNLWQEQVLDVEGQQSAPVASSSRFNLADREYFRLLSWTVTHFPVNCSLREGHRSQRAPSHQSKRLGLLPR